MLRLVASVTDQFKLAVCPVVTQEGLAVKLAITGAWPGGGGGELPPPPQPTARALQVTAMVTPTGFDILMKQLRLTAPGQGTHRCLGVIEDAKRSRNTLAITKTNSVSVAASLLRPR